MSEDTEIQMLRDKLGRSRIKNLRLKIALFRCKLKGRLSENRHKTDYGAAISTSLFIENERDQLRLTEAKYIFMLKELTAERDQLKMMLEACRGEEK